ncbi:MAG: 6-hydroxy-3-succinoylpyridine 3-monooxygenase HspA [Candidatus Anoxychlamydiales bacterium]|nr:6-hydroxy-3-succinoylpyridine 3-monooxygenase HspA [Candidatus Anoxychlamydiales bacterium]
MQRNRVISFIDGFNLYHAINNLNQSHLKWLNLHSLSKTFIKSKSEILSKVFYFSAWVNHRNKAAQYRQKCYVNALKIMGVNTILGHFKRKDRKCPKCFSKWTGHEEKETDVNIALYLLDLAYQDAFDRAVIISNDSDLAPAIRLVKKLFPKKCITTIAPPYCYHSNELIKASSDKSKIRIKHLERCLLPEVVTDSSKLIKIKRPKEYSSSSLIHN